MLLKKRGVVLILVFLLILNYVSASSLMALEANVFDSSGSATSGNITVEIYKSLNGSGLFLENFSILASLALVIVLFVEKNIQALSFSEVKNG